MSQILFYFFAVVMLAFAGMVVINRNPVSSALSLVVSFLGLAALFVMLDAFFIGTIQVLVYAGAVMVLFLFIIMLLDLKAEERRKLNPVSVIGGVFVAVAFAVQIAAVLGGFEKGKHTFPPLAEGTLGDVKQVGITLFTGYNFPLQIIGVLLLVSTIGVVVLSKKDLK